MPENVGLGVQPPDYFTKLGQLVNIQHAAAQAQMAQQDAAQRKNIADYDWNKHMGEDGTLDVDSFARDPGARIVFGDQYIDYLGKANTARQQQLESKSKLLALRTDQRKAFADMVTGLGSDPDVVEDGEKGRQKVNEAFLQFQKIYGSKDTLPVLEAFGPQLGAVPKGKMQNALRIIGLQTADAEKQLLMQIPTYTSTGAKLTNTNPLSVNAPDISMEIPPGAVPVTDANGRIFFANPQSPSNPRPVGAPASGPSPGASPTAPTFIQPVAGQKDLEEHVAQVRKADTDYGVNRHVNDELLRLSSDTSTGPGSALWHTGALGKITGTFGGNAAADYQKIGAYLDRQAALSAQQMGLPETNAGLQTAANLSGTTEYTPEALQTKVKLTDSMVEGAHQYRKGLDKVIGTGPNQDLSKLQEFRAQWADNFDPYVFRAENALRRGDKKELATIREELGTRGMAELKRKSENLEKLERGELLK